MFAKLLTLVLALGLVASLLLVLRQQRLGAVHEIALAHRRLAERQAEAWMQRRDIADACRPEAVRDAIEIDGAGWAGIVVPAPPPSPGTPGRG